MLKVAFVSYLVERTENGVRLSEYYIKELTIGG